MDEKIRLIKSNITEEECEFMCDDELFNCISCSCFNECCMKAEIKCDSDFATSINFVPITPKMIFWE